MSLPNEDFYPTTFSFDDPTFDESVLYEDFSLPQKPFIPDTTEHFVIHQTKNDQLFQDIHQLDEPNPQNDPPREPFPFPEPENEAHHLKPLDELDILLQPTVDIQQTPQADYDIPAQQLHHPLLPDDLSSPVPDNSSKITEQPLLLNTATSKLDPLNQGRGLVQQPREPSFTHAAETEHHTTDAENADITMAELNAVIDRHVRETQLEERQESIAAKRPLHICEATNTLDLFPDILNPASTEGNLRSSPPQQLIQNTANTTEMPPPKRQRMESLPPSIFSKPTYQSLQRPFTNLQRSNREQPSSNGAERPRKRTRTRIEDMDPSMVHVCNFPGCTKKFAKKYNLKIHQRRHNGDLPFLCEYAGCEKKFMWLSSFSRHLRVHESRRNGGRRRRERVQSADLQNYDGAPEREPDIAISDNFSILSISSVKLFVENELSEDVSFACALTALDSKPCESLIPVAKIAQAKRHQLLFTARSEEFCRQHAMPYDMNNDQLQKLCQLLSVHPDGTVDHSNSVF